MSCHLMTKLSGFLLLSIPILYFGNYFKETLNILDII